MLLTSHGFRDVHNMTESHAIAILNVLSGVKNKPAPPIVNDNPQTKTTRWVSTKRINPKPVKESP